MNEGPRRRRLRETAPPPSEHTFPLLPLFVVVVLAGLGLGYLLSHHFAGTQRTTVGTTTMAVPSPSALAPASSTPATDSPSPMASLHPTPTPRQRPAPSTRPTPHRIALTTPRPKATASPAPTSSPSPVPTLPAQTPTPVPRSEPTPVRTLRPATARPAVPRSAPSGPPAVLSAAGAAAQLARDYVQAVIGGDPVTANRALGRAPDNGDFPERQFLNKSSHITSVHTTANSNGSYTVETEIQGTKGTYYCTFQTAHNDVALYLSEHDCIPVQ